jgi:hypothetical protein
VADSADLVQETPARGSLEESLPDDSEVPDLELRSFDLFSERGWEDLVSMALRERRPRLSYSGRLDIDPFQRRAESRSFLRRPAPVRNARCPCGSGRKHKSCCGRDAC